MNANIVLFLPLIASAAYGAGTVFPERPIRIVVPFPPGGGSDFIARVLAAKAPAVLGQNGVVDNRAGAASLLGTQLVANAANDGYTLLLADTPFAVNHAIYDKAGYDPIKSFTPISQLATTPMMLVVHPAISATNVQEFIALAKAQPGKLRISNGGIGTIAHLAGALLMISTGIDLATIQYKGGGPALIGLMAGEAQAYVGPAPVVMPHIKSGKVRVLGVASAKRSSFATDVPTMQEAGVTGYVVTNWYLVAAPANTPAPVVAKLHGAFVKILEQRDTIERFAATLIEVSPSASPKEARDMIASEVAGWSRVVKAAGIRLE